MTVRELIAQLLDAELSTKVEIKLWDITNQIWSEDDSAYCTVVRDQMTGQVTSVKIVGVWRPT